MSGSDTTPTPAPDDGTERAHAEDPAEGPDAGADKPVERAHPQDPAEGADDPEVTEAQ
jgi:hypothetical protein